MDKRYRVTQTGRDLYLEPGRVVSITSKEYRFRWTAKLSARFNKGLSPLGLIYYDTELEEI